jgi:hypothetical protein
MFELMGKSAVTGALANSSAAGIMAEAQGTEERSAVPPSRLPGTEPLTREGDLAAQMVAGIRSYLADRTAASIDQRGTIWNRDYSSRAAYEASIAPQRERFRHIIGLVDPRIPFISP